VRKITNFLTSAVVAVCAVAIAVISVQNFTAVSLKFLTFQSIDIPLGVLLSFCFGGGLLMGGFVPFFLRPSKAKIRSRRGRALPREDRQQYDYFDEDDPLENWD
jgi:uncharacterized integral membrane protein